ncbi:hypothetical protein MTR67_044296 [Solanum verrucosum]|uniref:non-specific serine/threonine protein kinase n=1 Tax=Solanum verrucosum TaxID=315347 RepID=A0AAF0ZTG2_SOLVR|nr:hypothetical protein MTR67_044296 [Solanum verrucosum]
MVLFASLKYLFLIPLVTSLSFNFDTFTPNDHNVTYERDASPENGAILLTKNLLNRDINATPAGSTIPYNTTRGGSLGLTSNNERLNSSSNHFVAVEFDTYQNLYDPKGDHVGVDINSMQSLVNVTWFSSIPNGTKTDAWISYNSNSKNLTVVFTGFQLQGNNITVTVLQNLSYNLDLREYLPEWVTFGFTGGAGRRFAFQRIYSWNFTSSLDNMTDTEVTLSNTKPKDAPTKTKLGLVVGLISGGCVLVLFAFWRKSKVREDDYVFDGSMTNEFQKSAGPKKFLYSELARCTNNFSQEEMLGRGGFGGVYKGYLSESNSYIAVKRVSRESQQGIKDGKSHLAWPLRFKIAQGLALALLYLHEEWEQCVVHRHIKSRNIMLDSNFNAKLGDFGLARLVDHDKGSQTTVFLAGTMGYMAPECVTTGKANKETDVYSFGIVVLEIGCGRKPIDPKAEEHQVNIVDWVWRLYGMRNILEAVDPKLSSEFNEEEMEHLLIVGLWCAHPDSNCRPSIRQAVQVLNFEAPLPTLPRNMPVPTYCSFSHHLPTISVSSTHETNGTEIALAQIQHSVNENNTDASIKRTFSSASSSSTSVLYPS